MTIIARDMVLALLGSRSVTATICPSEVARAMTCDKDWRAAMPAVHAAVDALLADGFLELSWKGEVLPNRAGPYRIGRRGKC